MNRSITIAFALLSCSQLAFARQTEKPNTSKTAAVKDACFAHKLGDVIGGNVRNVQGENLGEIEELVLNPQTGDIEYAVLSFGGFLGVGDKLFALPWPVLEPVHGKDDHLHFLLEVDKEQLKKSPGFPKDNWPDISSREWSDSIRKFYEKELQGRGHAADKAIEASKSFNLVKASDVKGCDVDTSDGSDAGELSDLAIDLARGRVAYLVLSSGGFLGFGTDKYPIPWEACNFKIEKDKDLACKLNVPKAKFEKAPAYDEDWKTMSDPVFVERVYVYYGYPTYWKGAAVEAGSKG